MNTANKISAVIFDCDGVLFDSRQANINFYNHLLVRFGLPPMKEEEIEFVHMHTARESICRIFEGTPYAEMADQYRGQMDYSPFIKDMIMEPGVKELLGWLSPRFGLGLATSRSTTIGEVLKSNGLSEYFDIVVSSLDVKNPKPHPESLLKILEFFEIRAEQALYVGDSLVDYETASAAGVPFVSYKNSGLQADHHVDFLKDIVDVVGRYASGEHN